MKKLYFLTLVLFLFSKTLFAQEPYLGEIKIFAGDFAPRGWMKCEGQLLSISQYGALFTLLGTTYGGDGQSTFALPDYRGRAAVSSGPITSQGVKKGTESITLIPANLPAHTHTASLKVSSAKATTNVPAAAAVIASPAITVNTTTRDILGYNTAAPNTALLSSVNAASSAGITPVNTMQPYLVVTYIIAIEGIFPSQN